MKKMEEFKTWDELTAREQDLVLFIDNDASFYEEKKRRAKDMVNGGAMLVENHFRAQERLARKASGTYRRTCDRSKHWDDEEISNIAEFLTKRFSRQLQDGEWDWLKE